MSAQIDIISERREPVQGSRVRTEEIGKASTATLDDRYRFSARSVNLTWRLCVKRSLRPFANELETKTQVKSLFAAGSLLLACDGLGDLPLEDTESFRFCARIFLEITPIGIQIIITLYKKVIIIQKEGRHFVTLAHLLSDKWRYQCCYCHSVIPVHPELPSEIGLGAAFQRFSGETRVQHHV
jgi:hypothetical protein